MVSVEPNPSFEHNAIFNKRSSGGQLISFEKLEGEPRALKIYVDHEFFASIPLHREIVQSFQMDSAFLDSLFFLSIHLSHFFYIVLLCVR